MNELYIGTSGWTYTPWRGQFYPKGLAQRDWLAFYAQHFNAVEINATFYRSFPETIYARWHDAVPPTFRFALKGPKVITHEKALADVQVELDQFVSDSNVLGDKRGVLLWQFPASLHADDAVLERLAHFLALLPTSVAQVFEFRHNSWLSEDVFKLLSRHRAGLVSQDRSSLQPTPTAVSSVTYVRFHGPGKRYDSLYSPEELQAWADRLRPRLPAQTLYLFFNNTMAGQALDNARDLRSLLTDSG